MANYESIEKEQLDKAKQQQSQYETERNQQSQAMIDQINQAIDAATRPVQQQYQQQIENVPEQYKKLYSANAVQQMVGRKLLEEQMANMGLTNSGLNRTQQTALTLQRGNADNSVRTQEQAARDELNAALSKLLADAAAQKQQQAAQITNQAASDILGNRTNLYNNAVNAAVEEYNAVLQNEIAKQQLAQQQAQLRAEQELKQKQLELEQARWQAEQALQQKQLELEQANLPERYKQEAVQILLGQGYTYPEALNMVFGNGAAGSSGANSPLSAAQLGAQIGTQAANQVSGRNFSQAENAAIQAARERTMANNYKQALSLLVPVFKDISSLVRAAETAGIPNQVLNDYAKAIINGTTQRYLFGN